MLSTDLRSLTGCARLATRRCVRGRRQRGRFERARHGVRLMHLRMTGGDGIQAELLHERLTIHGVLT